MIIVCSNPFCLYPVILICFVLLTDPEEIRRAQEDMRNQAVPSIANLLPGAARSN